MNTYRRKEYKNRKALENNRGDLIYEFVLWSPAIALGLFIFYIFIFIIRFQKGWNQKINIEDYTVDSVGITDLNSEPVLEIFKLKSPR